MCVITKNSPHLIYIEPIVRCFVLDEFGEIGVFCTYLMLLLYIIFLFNLPKYIYININNSA